MFLGRTLNKELLVGLAKAVSVDMAFEVKKKNLLDVAHFTV